MSSGSPAIPVMWLMVFAMIAMGVYLLDNQGILNIGTDADDTSIIPLIPTDDVDKLAEEVSEKIGGTEGYKVWCVIKVDNPVEPSELMLLENAAQDECGVDKTTPCTISSPTIKKYLGIVQSGYYPMSPGGLFRSTNEAIIAFDGSFYEQGNFVTIKEEVENPILWQSNVGEFSMLIMDLRADETKFALKIITKVNLKEETGKGVTIPEGEQRPNTTSFCVPKQDTYNVWVGLRTGPDGENVQFYERRVVV